MRQLPPNIHEHQHGRVRQPAWVLLLPAYTLLPLLRSPLGYEVAYPRHAFAWLLILMVIGGVVALFYPPAAMGFRWFAAVCLLSFVASCVQFVQRWRGQGRGEEIHTLEAGYSLLAWHSDLPVPLVEQLLIPAGLAAIGWGIAHTFSAELGWWLFVGGFSYALMARWEYRMLWAAIREPVNQMIRAKLFEQRLDAHERKARRYAPHAQRPQAAGSDSDEPDVAGFAKHPPRRPAWRDTAAEPPDVAGWNADSDSTVPDYMAWFRRARRSSSGAQGTPPARTDNT